MSGSLEIEFQEIEIGDQKFSLIMSLNSFTFFRRFKVLKASGSVNSQ
jgi:hypothetical protein